MRLENLPGAHEALRRCLVRPFLTQLGKKSDQIHEFVLAQLCGKPHWHERNRAHVSSCHFLSGHSDLHPLCIAHHDFRIILPGNCTRYHIARPGSYHRGMVALLDLLTGLQHRLNEVVYRSTRPNAH